MVLFQTAVAIRDTSAVGAARRAAAEIAATLGFDATRSGEVALAVTEIATNILKHARHGQVVLRPLERAGTVGIEVLGLDQGPGIENPTLSLRDGHSTSGSSGTGLGALARLSSDFDIYSQVGKGTAVRLELWAADVPTPEAAVEIGAISLPKAGESVCGDAWTVVRHARGITILVADGLGHGPEAHHAARKACEVLSTKPDVSPTETIEACHAALAPTRGAAAAVARLETTHELLGFAGVGNIAARIERPPVARNLVSYNGILGHTLRRAQEFSFPFPRGMLLVLHSDGLGSHWALANYPGLVSKHPGLIAGVLYRDYHRGRDDVTVVVARNAAGSHADKA